MRNGKPRNTPRGAGGPPGRAAPRPARGKTETTPGGTWLYGVHAVLAALQNPARRCHRLLATANGAAHLPPSLRIKPEIVPAETLGAHLPREAVHQGLALQSDPLADPGLDGACDCGPHEQALVVALDQVTDPHNVGAILRSACAFGARALVLTERHAPQAIGTLAKSASGALEHVPMVRIVNLARGLDELRELGYWIIGLDEAAPQSLSEIKPPAKTVLVLGAEGDGLRRLTRERCDILVRLPTSGPIGSLNVSNAAAVALYALASAPPQG